MAEIELDLLARATIEQNGRHFWLILDDGVNRVRCKLPPETSTEPFPHQAVMGLGLRIEREATTARRLAIYYLPQIAT